MLTENKEKLTAHLNNYPAMVELTIQAMRDLPDDLPGYLYPSLNPGQLRIDVPWNTDIREFRNHLGQAWKINNKPRLHGNGDVYRYYIHKETGVDLTE